MTRWTWQCGRYVRIAALVILTVFTARATAFAAVEVDPVTPRIDITDAVRPFDGAQVDPGTLGRDVGWFYVDLINTSDQPQTRIVRFIDPAPGRLTFWGGTDRHEILSVHADNQEGRQLERVSGLSFPAARLVLPPGQTIALAFQVENPSAEGGVELWRESSLMVQERRGVLRTTLLAGILIAAAAYLLALTLLKLGSAPSQAMAAMISSLVALFAHERVFGDAPFQGFVTAESLSAAGIAVAGGFGIAHLRRTLSETLRAPWIDYTSRGLEYLCFALGALALIGVPGSRSVILGFLAVVIALGLAAVLVAHRLGNSVAMRQLPALAVMALACVLGVVYLNFLAIDFPDWEVISSGTITVGLALLAFAASPTSALGLTAPAQGEMPATGALAPAPSAPTLIEQAPLEEQTYALALRAANLGLWDWDIEHDRLSLSATLGSILGMSQGELNGPETHWYDRIHPDDRELYEGALNGYRAKGHVSFSLEFRVRHADGTYRWIQLRASCVPGIEGVATRCVGVVSDITARKLHDAKILEEALRDTLTGLASRTIVLDRLQRVIEARRRGAPERAALIVIDLDRFKLINDGLGLVGGDMVLISVARRLEETARLADVIARLSGDEFVILVQGPMVGTTQELSQALCRDLALPHLIEGRPVTATASIGIAELRGEHSEADQVLHEAERAMYVAKEAGGNRAERFVPGIPQSGSERLSLEQALRAALENREMELHFQPIVSLKGGETVGFEALMRWNRGEAGTLGAEEFLRLAEGAGLMRDLADFALETALENLVKWNAIRKDEAPLYVAVNVGARELVEPHFTELVSQKLAAAAVEPHCLTIEITETAMMSNPEAALTALEQLKERGVGLALDDFGTGYSSLSYLHRYPFDAIKIDKTFLETLSVKEETRAIVKTIIAMAHQLSLKVVAEGIESDAIASRLARMGCDFGQGHAFGLALTPQQAEARITPQAVEA